MINTYRDGEFTVGWDAPEAWIADGGFDSIVNLVEQDGDEVAVGINYPIFNEFGLSDDIQSAIRMAGKGGTIRIDMNSPGGGVFTAAETVSRLESFRSDGGTVKVRVLGLAASAAQYITMAASPGEIVMFPDAQIMIHRVQGFPFYAGDADYIQKSVSAYLRSMRNAEGNLTRRIAARARLPQKRVREMMDEETWLTARQAVSRRLADSVWTPSAAEDEDDSVVESTQNVAGSTQSIDRAEPRSEGLAETNAGPGACDILAVASLLERRLGQTNGGLRNA